MTLIPSSLVFALNAYGMTSRIRAAREEHFDPWPVVKLYNPLGPATWLATELADDGDTLFGLADLGFGCPELGAFSLSEIRAVRLPFGMAIERDLHFDAIARAEAAMRRRKSDQLLPDPTGEGI